MNHLTSEINGTLRPQEERLSVYGEWHKTVYRADGSVERATIRNVVTAAGMNRIANRAVQATGTTPFFVIVVGTATATPADTDGQAQMGEVLRKSSIVSGASAQSREWIFLTATYAGNTDTLTGVALTSAGISDFPNSHASTGIIGNRVNSLATTLAASDFLALTVRIRVGSHNQAHST